MSRIFAYSRVSTKDQTTDNQLLAIQQAGYPIAKGRFFQDVISGSTPAMSRPEFQRMIDRLEEGDQVVVFELSRLGRDTIDVMSTVKMFKEKAIKLVVLQLGNLDLTSPSGELMVNVIAAVAQMEKALLIERVNAGLERARYEGKKLGRPSKTTEEQKAEIRTLSVQGFSVSDLARQFKVSRASILNVLQH